MVEVRSTREVERVPLFLAPMEGVTDLAYRLLAREAGADVTATEFTSSAGLSRGAERSWAKVRTDPREAPFVAQIFGGDEDEMVATARELGRTADIIDLNFGCPAPKVCRSDAGAALLSDPDRVVRLVRAVMQATDRPVSVKLRLGTGRGEPTALEIAQRLDEAGILRLVVHGRTLSQRYSGEADWSALARIVAAVSMPVVANGDIRDVESARRCLEVTAAAGLMVGRAAIGDPLVFDRIATGLGWITPTHEWRRGLDPEDSPTAARIVGAQWAWTRYLALVSEVSVDSVDRLRRHAQAFTRGMPGGRRLRATLATLRDAGAIEHATHEAMAEGLAKVRAAGLAT